MADLFEMGNLSFGEVGGGYCNRLWLGVWWICPPEESVEAFPLPSGGFIHIWNILILVAGLNIASLTSIKSLPGYKRILSNEVVIVINGKGFTFHCL